MKNRLFIGIAALGFFLQGCASTGRATLLGAGVGAAAGSGVGLLADPGRKGQHRARNVIVGGALGGLLGAGVGYVTQELVERGQNEAYAKGKEERQTNGAAPTTGTPVLIPPRVESRFVDDVVRGSTFVPAHVEYQIVEPARWSR